MPKNIFISAEFFWTSYILRDCDTIEIFYDWWKISKLLPLFLCGKSFDVNPLHLNFCIWSVLTVILKTGSVVCYNLNKYVFLNKILQLFSNLYVVQKFTCQKASARMPVISNLWQNFHIMSWDRMNKTNWDHFWYCG